MIINKPQGQLVALLLWTSQDGMKVLLPPGNEMGKIPKGVYKEILGEWVDKNICC
jgi:hypothetical protein